MNKLANEIAWRTASDSIAAGNIGASFGANVAAIQVAIIHFAREIDSFMKPRSMPKSADSTITKMMTTSTTVMRNLCGS